MGSDDLRKKGCRKGKGFRFWFIFLIFVADFLLLICLIFTEFRWICNCFLKTFTDVNLLNSPAHFYQCYVQFVIKRQTAFTDILAATNICAKGGCLPFVNRLRI